MRLKLIHQRVIGTWCHYVWRDGPVSVGYVGNLPPSEFIPRIRKWYKKVKPKDGCWFFTTKKLLAGPVEMESVVFKG